MRIEYNLYKDKLQESSKYLRQVIIPVYILSNEVRFKDRFDILKLCLEYLLNAVYYKKNFLLVW